MKSQRQGLWFHLLDVVFNIVVIVAIVAGIRTFLVSPFQVEGNSMVDTLEDKQYIIINKLAYLLGNPGRGDVVVFRPPNDPGKYYVKRVIGLPGDEVIIREGFVYLKESGEGEERKLTEETYLNDRNEGKTYRHPPGSGDTSTVQYKVPEGHFFLLGDNRQGSLDSRSFTADNAVPSPYVASKSIKGRVWFIALPITKIHALEPPVYGL
ncbi:MAG: signal peptidase I [Candidatus Peregrinibacteria bacterium]|nr:signal peptidase I [Candidatus Peregrinibacteria bacterium]